jgi:hypothetical protein
MWRIIRAEFSYDKFRIMLIFLFCIICFITIWYGVKWERNRVPMIMLIMLVGTILISFINGKTRLLQKRDIMYLTLPIVLRKIGILHLLIPFSSWLSIVAVFYISSLIIQPFSETILTIPSILHLLTLNGLILYVIAAYLLQRDLMAIIVKQSKKTLVFIVWLISYFTALLPFFIVTNFAGIFGENTSLHLFLLNLFVSPIWINVFGVLIAGISFLVFIKRKSYA